MSRSPALPTLLLAALLTLSAAPAAPSPSPTRAPGGPAGAAEVESSRPDPASEAGRPVDPHPDVEQVFAAPTTELPSGTLRHTPYDKPDWARTFDVDAPPEWEFDPAPAPDLFVSEPEYGGVDAGLVRVASAILGRTAPWEMSRDRARELVARAREEAAVLTTITRTSFDREGLLTASRRLGQPATSLWDLDVGLLAGAAAGSLERALATWDVEVEDPGRVGAVTAALRRAQRRAGLPDEVDGTNLSRLSTRSAVARADGATRHGLQVDLGEPSTVAGLLQRRDMTVDLRDGGIARGHLLVWHPDDPAVELTTDLASGWDARASVRDAAARLGAVAAVNGGFWLDTADPDGLLVTDGRMRSDTTAWTGTVRGVRGALGVGEEGVVVGRPDWQVRLHRKGRTVPVHALNRPARPGQTVAWNADGPPPTGLAPSWWRVPGVGRTGEAVPLPGPAAPTAGTLVVATSEDLSGRWTTETVASPGWERLEDGIAGGPRLLEDGEPTPAGWWIGEGFDVAHTHRRHPRTAVGVDPYGGMLVLVLDGRQPGWSDGATQAETQAIMQALGAEDATMLDGGGSTQLVVDGAVRNRPCCDAGDRPVATVAAFVPRR